MESAILKMLGDKDGFHQTEFGYFKNKEGFEVRLHDDPYHKAIYTRKGFIYIGKETTVYDHHKPLSPGQMQKLIDASKGDDSSIPQEDTIETFICDVCGTQFSNPTALGCHKRIHKKKMRRT